MDKGQAIRDKGKRKRDKGTPPTAQQALKNLKIPEFSKATPDDLIAQYCYCWISYNYQNKDVC